MRPLYAAGTQLPAVYGGCVWDTFGCAGYVHDPHRLTNPNTVASCRLVTIWWLHSKLLRVKKMKTWNQFRSDRYRPLESNLTDTKPLIIDTEANPQDILECAVEWVKQQVQISIDDPRPSVSDEDARRIFAAKRDALRQRVR
ncbi:hypothetical protein ACIQVE_25425 [Pseudomonas sp. NPDC098747]|uniref:hypothetical protein n=1 Tax=Pseudomonas sp. NPDC098747 TaxID=3364487 RepID=UPI00383A1DC2